ncbi:mucin-2-like [Anguilla rostrata]|uniref:mucin-2-like n=1 Tax=Anguilla rostrata TaxID=7938 RepID=UPI0030D3C354
MNLPTTNAEAQTTATETATTIASQTTIPPTTMRAEFTTVAPTTKTAPSTTAVHTTLGTPATTEAPTTTITPTSAASASTSSESLTSTAAQTTTSPRRIMGTFSIFIRLVFHTIKPVPSESKILTMAHTLLDARLWRVNAPVRVRRSITQLNDPVAVQDITYQILSNSSFALALRYQINNVSMPELTELRTETYKLIQDSINNLLNQILTQPDANPSIFPQASFTDTANQIQAIVDYVYQEGDIQDPSEFLTAVLTAIGWLTTTTTPTTEPPTTTVTQTTIPPTAESITIILTTKTVPPTTAVHTTLGTPAKTEVPTTMNLPTTTAEAQTTTTKTATTIAAQTTIPPSTIAAQTTTIAPTTKTAPSTTAVHTTLGTLATTEAPTTMNLPTTNAEAQTTATETATTIASQTTIPPTTMRAESTTVAPTTKTAPSTTAVHTTLGTPATTEGPSTTITPTSAASASTLSGSLTSTAAQTTTSPRRIMGTVLIFIRLVFHTIKPVPSESKILTMAHTLLDPRLWRVNAPVRARRSITQLNDPVAVQDITYQILSNSSFALALRYQINNVSMPELTELRTETYKLIQDSINNLLNQILTQPDANPSIFPQASFTDTANQIQAIVEYPCFICFFSGFNFYF